MERPNPFLSIKDISKSSLIRISTQNIFFGHQSIGYNIIDGIKDIIKENDKISLNIVEINETKSFTLPVLAHFKVGKNRDPISKINTFSNYIEKGIGEKADIAFFKFCYVDFHTATEIDKIYNTYKTSMSRLKEMYPNITFIHVTVPLVVRERGVKAAVKKILGRSLRGYDDNIVRNKFNEMLRKEYSGKEPLFDLAQIESTYPNGRRPVYKKNGHNYYELVPEYTYDGGHLNEKSRRIVAEQLLILLAKLAE